MSVNKRGGNRGREDALRYGSVSDSSTELHEEKVLSSCDCMCCTFITTSECVSECFSLRVDQSLTKTNVKYLYIYIYIYKSMNVLSAECVSRLYRTHCEYTHTWMLPWCVCLFDILWFCRAAYPRVCWMCVLYVLFFWQVAQFNKVLNVTVKVRSKLWPGWRVFSSLWGVFTTTICHLSTFWVNNFPPGAYTDRLCAELPQSVSEYAHSYKCMKPLV